MILNINGHISTSPSFVFIANAICSIHNHYDKKLCYQICFIHNVGDPQWETRNYINTHSEKELHE
jgi:hypothetical protein